MHRFVSTTLRELELFVQVQSLHQHHAGLLQDRYHREQHESIVESLQQHSVMLQDACNSCAVLQFLQEVHLGFQVVRERFAFDEAL